MVDVARVYDQLLSAGVDATYRGLPFTMIDSSDETGRRALRFFFPGQDLTAYQDLGAMDGAIRVTGLLIGDDYVRQAQRMRDAFRSPGAGTLLSPWLGELQVVLMQPAPITFSQTEYRVARFTAEFAPYLPPAQDEPDQLTRLLDAVADLKTQIGLLIAQVLAPVSLALSVVGYVQSFCAQLAAVWDGLTGASGAVAAAVAAPVADLEAVSQLPVSVGSDASSTTLSSVSSSYASAVTAVLQAVPDAVAGASAKLLPAAIGPGAAPQPAAPIDARITVGILLSAASGAASAGVAASPGPALALAASCAVLASAADAVTDIAFSSQQEATGYRDQVAAAIDAAAASAAIVAASLPVQAGLVWRSLTALRAALIATLNSEIGTLAPVRTIHVPAAIPVWLVAQGVAGDDPSSLVAAVRDIVARNGLKSPSVCPAGPIEVLA